jgi:hypothetical protein
VDVYDEDVDLNDEGGWARELNGADLYLVPSEHK